MMLISTIVRGSGRELWGQGPGTRSQGKGRRETLRSGGICGVDLPFGSLLSSYIRVLFHHWHDASCLG
jgi:hypothetical protein